MTNPIPSLPRPCGIDANAICPPAATFQDEIVSLLQAVGLSELSEIGSNTPLDVIRHFARVQNYDYSLALFWATDSTLLLYVLGGVLALEKFALFANGRWMPGDLFRLYTFAVGRFVIWGMLGIFGWSAASQLLTGITPLIAREYMMASLWIISIALTALLAMLFVEVVALALWVLKYVLAFVLSMPGRLTRG